MYMVMLLFNFVMVGMVLGNVANVFGASDRIAQFMQYQADIPFRGG